MLLLSFRTQRSAVEESLGSITNANFAHEILSLYLQGLKDFAGTQVTFFTPRHCERSEALSHKNAKAMTACAYGALLKPDV